ncbi:peptidylprolyl isomerase, partial [Escherichia coli]|nr:peptidylprolyl isomerase [Escherichia coli]
MDPGPAPTDQQLQQYYAQNRARYTVAERRVARYATISPETVAQRATPTDAEIQQLEQQERARFAPTEQCTIR